MSFSLNEIEAMGKRAARGAGLPWGIAEEAGKAVRWLTARGLPGVEQLVDILTSNDQCDHRELVPVDEPGIWHAPSGRLCPLITGPALCDRAAEIAAGRVIELGQIAQPLMLMPYAASAARLTDTAIKLAWDDVMMTLSPGSELIDGNRDALTVKRTAGLRCCRADHIDNVDEPAVPVAMSVDAATWNRLTIFAHRTLAPATDASRLSGAGAGLSDDN